MFPTWLLLLFVSCSAAEHILVVGGDKDHTIERISLSSDSERPIKSEVVGHIPSELDNVFGEKLTSQFGLTVNQEGFAAFVYNNGTVETLSGIATLQDWKIHNAVNSLFEALGINITTPWDSVPLLPERPASPVTSIRIEGKSFGIRCGGQDNGLGKTGTDGSRECWKIDEDGESTPFPSMQTKRWGHTLTGFEDGSIVAVGGQMYKNTAEMYDPEHGYWRSIKAPSGSKGRLGASAVRLDDHRLMVCGGMGDDSCETYSKARNRWESGPTLQSNSYFGAMVKSGNNLIYIPRASRRIEMIDLNTYESSIFDKTLLHERETFAAWVID